MQLDKRDQVACHCQFLYSCSNKVTVVELPPLYGKA